MQASRTEQPGEGRRPAGARPARAWQRNLVAVLIAQTVSAMAFSFAMPFLPLYVQKLGVRGTGDAARWAGLIGAAAAASMIVAQPVWGNLADRWGRKPMVVRSMLGGALTIGAMGLAASPEQLMLLRFVQGGVTGVLAAATALVSTSTPRERLGFALGLMQVGLFTGTSVGPLVGGLIADTLGYRTAFYASGLLLGVGGLIVVAFVHESFTPPPREAGRPGILAESRSLLALGAFPAMVSVVFLIQLGGVVVTPVLSLFIAELSAGPSAELGASPGSAAGAANVATAAGLVLGAAGIASALSAVAVGRLGDRLGHTRVLPICLLGAALAYFPQGMVRELWQLLALRVLLGAFLGGLMPSANALIAGVVPRGRRGAAYGIIGTANALANGVGPLAGAGIATQWGLRAVFFATGVVFALTAGWVGLALRRLGRAPAKEG